MVNTELIRTIVGIVGNVISFFLFTSPTPTFLKVWKSKSVQEFRPDPYLATALNCALWAYYGTPFVQKDNILVLTINAFGLVLELIYILIFIVFSPWPKRKKIMIVVAIEVVVEVLVVFSTMYFVPSERQEKRATIVGIICIVFTILMYASPLTVIKQVIKTKSVKYMPFLLSLTNFVNGLIWMAYALLKFDLFILIPNALGALSGLLQLILYATYYKTTAWEAENEDSQEPV